MECGSHLSSAHPKVGGEPGAGTLAELLAPDGVMTQPERGDG
jgi:hypothetical protein